MYYSCFSKYAWAVPLKVKKDITTTNVLRKILDKSGRKSIKIWVDKGNEFYNRPMKSWLQGNKLYNIVNKCNNTYHKTITQSQ